MIRSLKRRSSEVVSIDSSSNKKAKVEETNLEKTEESDEYDQGKLPAKFSFIQKKPNQ